MKRHALSTRIWHWLNLLCVLIMLGSGLGISNAHPRLYWGDDGFIAGDQWLSVPNFPGILTIPSRYSLAASRDWHTLFAWPFALLVLFIWVAMLMNGHFRRDVATRRAQWRPAAIWADIRAHLRFEFEHPGEKFNFLQKLAYGVVLGVLLPGMIATGIAISPGMEPALPWLVDLLGGRQSARSLHFILAMGIGAFLILHVALVLASGPIGQIRAMITGGHQDAA